MSDSHQSGARENGATSVTLGVHVQTHRSIARHLEATVGDSNDRKSPLKRMLVPNCIVAACREPSYAPTVVG
jgi:hypothetical protein